MSIVKREREAMQEHRAHFNPEPWRLALPLTAAEIEAAQEDLTHEDWGLVGELYGDE